MKITLKQLKAKQACADQVAKFEALFGASVEVTRDLCVKHAGDFNFNWAAQCLLSAPALAAFNAARAPALAAYNAATADVWDAFDAAMVSAWATFNAARADALADYNAARADALAAFNAARAPALAAFNAAMALAFFDASILER